MSIQVSTLINAPAKTVWGLTTNIKDFHKVVEGINNIEVLEAPGEGIVGTKWKETRTMFGKEATETMWITEAKENEYYHTRAESHGSVYQSTVKMEEKGNQTELTMIFNAEPQTFMAKLMSKLFAPMVTKSIKKCFADDLADIKKVAESQT